MKIFVKGIKDNIVLNTKLSGYLGWKSEGEL